MNLKKAVTYSISYFTSFCIFLGSQASASFMEGDTKAVSFRHYPKQQNESVFNKEINDANNVFGKGKSNKILHWNASSSKDKSSSAAMITRQGFESNLATIQGKIYFPKQEALSSLNINFTFQDPAMKKNQKGVHLSNMKDGGAHPEYTENILDFKLIINNTDAMVVKMIHDNKIKIKSQSYCLLINDQFAKSKNILDTPVNTPIKNVTLKTFSMGGLEFFIDDLGFYNDMP